MCGVSTAVTATVELQFTGVELGAARHRTSTLARHERAVCHAGASPIDRAESAARGESGEGETGVAYIDSPSVYCLSVLTTPCKLCVLYFDSIACISHGIPYCVYRTYGIHTEAKSAEYMILYLYRVQKENIDEARALPMAL